MIKANKILRTTFIILTILIVGGFILNWYLTHRLEKHLNKILSEEISKATDGFYSFSFEKLSVGLFNGELAIEGIDLTPDPKVYNQWKQGDSLPGTYYIIHIGEIHFRGINLTWRRNYKELEFSLFEIKEPDVRIYSPITADTIKKIAHKPQKTLHEIISPFIDVLRVKTINLENADISYTIDDVDSPVIYALKRANLKAYGFLLDKNSAVSGKLLYCDNFEFSTHLHQDLLYSDQLVLGIDSIRLSTVDSIIRIGGIQLAPVDSLWDRRMDRTGWYLNSEIKSVVAKGVNFSRDSTLNYLNARSFDISSTNIQYFSTTLKQDIQTDTQPKATIDQTWSLYDILSPILHSISIDKIGIEKTKFNYTVIQGEDTDTYSLEQFDFHANKFLVNPYSEKIRKFWYVDNFALTGTDIKGNLKSKNAGIEISHLLLSTTDKRFKISDIEINPLSRKSRKDYLKGRITSINMDGLDYDTGVSAENLEIDSPNIEYFKVGSNSKRNTNQPSPEDVLDMLAPYSNYLSVNNINLKNGDITFHDIVKDEVFNLKHLNFFASKFLINEETRKRSRYLFYCDDIGLSFRDFDNILSEGNYRLQIKNAETSTLSGKFLLQDVRLIPQENTWKKAPDTYYSVSTPLISVAGFDNKTYIKNKAVNLKQVQVDSLQVGVVKMRQAPKQADNPGTDLFKNLSIGNMDINNLLVSYDDKKSNEQLNTNLKSLSLKSIKWDAKENLKIDRFSVSNTELSLKNPKDQMNIKYDLFDFTGLNWTMRNNLNLTAINIVNPSANINKDFQSKDSTKNSGSKNIYALLSPFANRIFVGKARIDNASINYDHTLDGAKQGSQTLNQTNLNIDQLDINTVDKKASMADLQFDTKDLRYPIMDGYYTIAIQHISADQRKEKLELSGIHMIPAYPKMEFAYKHPKHKDWFDVSVGEIALAGMNYPLLFSENKLEADNLKLKDVILLNFKNKQIYTPPLKQPLIYEKLQELPMKVDIKAADVSNFSVVYEELARKGTIPGKISFMEMNAKVTGITNVVSYPNQIMRLDAEGKLMGTGAFTARWDMPVSPDYDCFELSTHLHNFDLTDLNQIISPLAPAEVKDGVVRDLIFHTEASSTDARANMVFIYDSLRVNIFKNMQEGSYNKLFTRLANRLIDKNNPKKDGDKLREADIYIKRDPYHSNFNYFWQILQPATVESIGVSQGKQNFIKKVAGFFTKVKNFFTEKKEPRQEVPKEL